MLEREHLKNFITAYMNLRKKQNEYFRFKHTNVLKECKRMESQLDELAQRLMIDYDLNFSLEPEQPRLF